MMRAALLLLATFASTWGAAFAQAPGKRILLEKITSAGCPSCPDGDLRLQALRSADPSLIVVAVHRADHWHPDSMACPDGNALLGEYLWAHPTLMVDRIKWPDFAHVSLLSSMWTAKVELRRQDPIRATVGGSTTYDPGTRALTVTIDAIAAASLSAEHRLNAYIIEDEVTGSGLGYDQLNGYNASTGHPLFGLGDTLRGYTHHWVLRDMLGGHHGQAGSFSTPALPGDSYSHTFQTTLDPRWDADSIQVVVMVQKHHADPQAREILNAQLLPLNASIAAGRPDPNASGMSIHPQPATDLARLELPRPGTWRIHLHDLQGRSMRSLSVQGTSTDIHRSGLPAGTYLLQAVPEAGAPITRRITFH